MTIQKNNRIIIISGPTATGKTKLSLSLAKLLNTEIINFDSLCFYKEISIGTAKPTPQELKFATHHLISFASISKALNASDFVKLAWPIIDNIHESGRPVILVGGSGFYLQALLYGMYNSNTTPKEIISRSEALYKNQGIEEFRKILKKYDPVSYEELHENDHYRIRRAVEHYWTNGTTLSSEKINNKQMLHNKDWKVLHIHLDIPKEDHFKIIKKRTQTMIDNGLIQEVKDLLGQNFTGQEKPLRSIGYKETQDYLNGSISSIEELSDRINISTRQLAKAQRTWFKSKKELERFDPTTDESKIITVVEKFTQQ